MIHLAVQYNNLGVDILSGNYEETINECRNLDRDKFSTNTSAKRRRLSNKKNGEVKQKVAETEDKVNKALACFQKALSLIVETTEHHHYRGGGLKYQPNDADGFLRYDDEKMAKQLVESINPCATEIQLEGENGCSNTYIYCKAIKIDGDHRSKTKYYCNNRSDFVNSNEGESEEINSTTSFNAQQEEERRQKHRRRQNKNTRGNSRDIETGGYDSLTKSIFHSMICIYNIGLCYQYKGMTTKEKAKRLQSTELEADAASSRLYSFHLGELIAASEYFLKASVDHYTRAYELMSRFRLENGSQFMVLMGTMNNLAATYQSLEQTYKADVCNRYLVRSLILIICSSERDGHLGQEVLSRSSNGHQDEDGQRKGNRSGVLSREEDRRSFESFLANVTYLLTGGDEMYRGEITAAAA